MYHLAKSIETRCNLEYRSDSGRIDAIILIEAKSSLDYGRLGSLEDRAARLESLEDSLRRYLKTEIPPFKKDKWGLEGPDEVWGVLLAETFAERWRDRWMSLPNNATYPVLRTYTYDAQPSPLFVKWNHLLGFKRIT